MKKLDPEEILCERERGFYEQVKYIRSRIKELDCKNCEVSKRRKHFLQSELRALEKYLDIGENEAN